VEANLRQRARGARSVLWTLEKSAPEEEAMQFLSRNGQIVQVEDRVLKALEKILELFGTRQKALRALKEYVVAPGNADIKKILEKVGIDESAFGEFLRTNQAALTALLGAIGDLAEHELAWSLSKAKKLGNDMWSVAGSASFQASIDVDVREEEDKETPVEELGLTLGDQDALAAIGVEGTVSVGGRVTAAAPVAGGVLTGSIAFDAGAEILLENCFLHQRTEPAIPALAEDIGDFTLPFAIGSADDLRHLSRSGVVVPTQWIRLKAAGHVNFGARLCWGRSWVNAAAIRNESLDIDESITVSPKLSASVSVSQALSGDFDLVLAASPTPGLVRVTLRKSRASQRQVGISLEGGVEIEGLDKIGKALLHQIQPAVDAVIGKIEEEEKAFPSLKKLVSGAVGAEVDALLDSTTVDDEIAKFLRKFGKDVDIAAKLKELAERKVLDLAGEEIQALDANLDKVRSAIKGMIERYRGLLTRLNAGLEKAAKLKLVTSFSRTWQKLRVHEAALIVDLDPRMHAQAYRDLVRGDFAPALAQFQAGDPGVHVEGKLKECGSLAVINQVSLSVFGLVLGSTSVLTEEWEMEVSASGDLMLAVKSAFERTSRLWRQSKTASFTVDGRVLDTLSAGLVTGNQRLSPTVSLELAHVSMPARKKEVDELQDEIVSLGVAQAPLDIRSDVTLPNVKDKKNPLSASIILDLEKRHLDAFLAHSLVAAERAFAEAVLELPLSPHRGLQVRDGSGRPFLLWKSVQEGLYDQNSFVTAASYASEDGAATLVVKKGELPFARQALIEVQRFRNYFRNLGNVQVALQGRTAAEALEVVKKAQMDLVRSAKGLIIRRGYDLALFRTVFRLANSAGDLDPVAIVTRNGDKKIFTYG
jgi:hypothetical protein